jgi:fructokinase
MDAAIFGHILADILAEPMDLRRPPPPGGLYSINSVTMTSGGNVPNTSVPMARFGMKVAAAGMVGRDVFGDALLRKLTEAGVDTQFVAIDDSVQTSATIVAVEPGGERCFFCSPGATALLTPDVFRSCFPLFRRCR